MIFGQSSKLSRFLPHTGRIVTILDSHWPKLSRFLPHALAETQLWEINIWFSCKNNNNRMQRICEEKARRILHLALIEDCQ